MKFKSITARVLALFIPGIVMIIAFYIIALYYVFPHLSDSRWLFVFVTVIPALGFVMTVASAYSVVPYLRKVTDKINNFADIVTSGDFSKRLHITEVDEFGQMERHLNAMISKFDEMNKRQSDLISVTESASRSKSDFLSRMSHEIRSPMNAIIGMTQIAKTAKESPKINDCLDKIGIASKHLLGLINDVLDMSKIEANKFELASEEFNLEKALNKIYGMMNVKAEEKKQSLSLCIDTNLPEYIVSDELRLSQVVANLVSNAIKFTDDCGVISIDVSEVERMGNLHTIKVSVSDSGIGLAPAQIDKLFKPFEQGDSSVSRKFGGTGLGLAISKRIVEMMDGDITVTSEPGAGSTFSFTARVPSGSGAIEEPRKGGRPKLSRSIEAKDMRILVVDDSDEANEYMAFALGTLGFSCERASDGAEAVEMVTKALTEKRMYDIIFMDYMMPRLNGIEAAKKIKDMADQNVSIVMVSIYDWKEFECKAREAGIAKCVSKPITPSTVLDSISEVTACVIKCNDSIITLPQKASFNEHAILLVDDIEINREIVCEFLSETGVIIDAAVNGVEAVEKFRANPDKYDVVLMDIQMPEMDGFEATRQIRAMNQNGKNIPIVAMTANALSEDVRKCKEAGMNDHMAKPVDPEALLFMLNDYFFMKRYLNKDIG